MRVVTDKRFRTRSIDCLQTQTHGLCSFIVFASKVSFPLSACPPIVPLGLWVFSRPETSGGSKRQNARAVSRRPPVVGTGTPDAMGSSNDHQNKTCRIKEHGRLSSSWTLLSLLWRHPRCLKTGSHSACQPRLPPWSRKIFLIPRCSMAFYLTDLPKFSTWKITLLFPDIPDVISST